MISVCHWRIGTIFFIPGILLLAIIATPPVSAQHGVDYDSESLFIALFANGDALVEYDVRINDPLDEEIRIKLFGSRHINDLIVRDLDDQLVDYDIGSPNEIVLNTPGVENVRISYTTPDLANRTSGIWTFWVDATIGPIVRLPVDSVLVAAEPIPAIRFVNDQPLLTFSSPGTIRITYSIGVLGTEDQANIAIQVAAATIREVRTNHPGIVLTAADDLLRRAVSAMEERRFSEAENLAGQANDAAAAAGRNYEAARDAINSAEAEITNAANGGRDVSSAQEILEQAKNQFASGDYVTARTSAENAVAAIRDMPEPMVPVGAIVAGAAAAGGVGVLLFLKTRKRHVPEPHRTEPPRTTNSNSSTAIIRPPSPPTEAAKEEEKTTAEPATDDLSVRKNVTPVAEPSTIPDSQFDKSALDRVVIKMLEEKAYLRPEDQQVLRFLAEREGAAFESEIRTKFQLPKTTIWRLVKRLEREELVEIRKAGGQNLIKLKFENRQV
ncbi:MAG TPA: hypothetical protein VNI77_07640 [Nitrososphaera sp.]|nr:hypothetical protein [Nitrososphaera sp.]